MRLQLSAFLLLFFILMLGDPVFGASAEKPKDNRVVKDGMLVTLDYTVKTPDGKLLETSKGSQPLKYIQGKKMMIPGLERELTGMKIGDEKHITIKPEDGYGKLNPNAVQEVPKEKVPPNALKVGAVLVGTNKDGSPIPMTVREIKDKTVVMDLNHPLAGKTLVFDVKVIDVEPAFPLPTQNQPTAPAQPSAPPKSAAPPQKK
ncbi:MAG: FKBP-type peptidyl-prolyl cis-trans isomerase [Candidatus Binatia bacterium]